MSTASHSQVNNKKGSQNGSNLVSNAPVQTTNTNTSITAIQVPTPSQSTSPPANNAPKYGTLVPNRVFVGGISANTTEGELTQLFSAYGTVKATKIISDRAGVSKGYGFVTFECEEDAKRLQRESDNIMLRERKLNIAPAIKKQPFNRAFEVPSPPPNPTAQTQFYYGGVPFGYQNSMAYFTPPQTTCTNGDPAAQPVYQAPPVYATPTAAPPATPYPMPMYPPQPLYVQQQYPYQPVHYDQHQFYPGGTQNLSTHQYMYGANGNSTSAMAPQQTSSTVANSSPTRHNYYQHLTYNPDNMYYNMPMYNGTIEPSSGIYTESIEPPGGTLTEVMYSPMEQAVAQGVSSVHNTSSLPPSCSSTQLIKQQYSNVPSPIMYNTPHIPANERNGYSHSCDNNVQPGNVTPVVSLLSLPHSNERDYRSMQSGRKHRTDKPTNHNHNSHNIHMSHSAMNGIHQPYRGMSNHHHHHHQQLQQQQQQPLNYIYQYAPNKGGRRVDRCDSNQCRSWSKKRRNVNSFNTDASSISSLRTNSNSSASVVDENLNEKKEKSNENSSSVPSCQYPPASPILTDQSRPVLQIQANHPNHSLHYQNQSSSVRRNRRNNPRRNAPHQHGNVVGQNEIGAGDAPIQSTNTSPEMIDVCKKIDSLQL